MKNAIIDIEIAVKNLHTTGKLLGITMQQASERLQHRAKFTSSEQVLKQINAYFKNAKYALSE